MLQLIYVTNLNRATSHLTLPVCHIIYNRCVTF